MKREVNIVSFGGKIPLSISIVQFDGVSRHMHANPQLILNLSGECEINMGSRVYSMRGNDMVIVNARQYHSLSSKGLSTIVSVFIDPQGFGVEPEDESGFSFRLNSMETPENPRLEPIRYLVYSIIKYNTMENLNSIYTNRAIAYSFFAQLVNDFKSTVEQAKGQGMMSTIVTLTDYVESHFSEGITLSSLAEKFGYAVPYVSRLFKQALGKSFLDYFDELRVNYAMDDLLSGKLSIEEIASTYGFDSARSYVRAFKKNYGVYPSEYRKQEQKGLVSTFGGSEDDLRKQSLDLIIQYLDEYNASTGNRKESVRDTTLSVSCNVSGKTAPYSKPSTSILSIEGVSPLLLGDQSKQIDAARKEIGYTTLHIQNLFSGGSSFLCPTINKKRVASLEAFDHIASLIMKMGMYPYIDFNYSPEYFSSMEEYEECTKEFIGYVANAYKAEKLRHWKFSFNERELSSSFLHVYQRLFEYSRSVCAVKIVSPSFELGKMEKEGLYEMFNYLCPDPDFTAFVPSYESESRLLEKNYLSNQIERLKSDGLWPNGRVIILNASFTSAWENLLFDTVYASSFLMKEALECRDRIYAFSTPYFSNRAFWKSKDEFFSGTPVFFDHGLKKASYQALTLLGKLGNEVLKFEKSCIYTKKDRGMSIVFGNYVHYSDLYAKNQYYELSKKERYRCFPKGTNKRFHLELSGLDCRKIEMKITSLGVDSGSSFDSWISMGSPEAMSEDELSTLKGLSEMRFTRETIDIQKGVANIEFSVAPFEIKLLEITYK